jgi:hypothetical protein
MANGTHQVSKKRGRASWELGRYINFYAFFSKLAVPVQFPVETPI